MSQQFAIEIALGLLPVLAFMALLINFDGYQLVGVRDVLAAVVAGAGIAGASYFVNGYAILQLGFSIENYSRFGAPLVEEFLKALFIIFLFTRNRIGFMIDAAILGFAVGTGFALTENYYFASQFPTASLGVFVVRGFGTAIMHGGATALFGVMAQSWTERHEKVNPLLYLPGFAAAVALHSAYNVFQATPLLATVVMLLALPAALAIVFTKSEHKIHTWLLTDYESHEHLLEDLKNGNFAKSEAGRFIQALADRFDKTVVANIFKYLQLHTELALLADKVSLAHETQEKVPIEHLRERFRELHRLERAIGRAAFWTVWPHLHFTKKELWELHELEEHMPTA
jgi:RsiW-degrading membrane proteinase PrsW (M82 family)